MRKHFTLSNILFGVLLILMLIPTTRVMIQSRLLRIFLASPDSTERSVNLRGREIVLYNMDDQPENLVLGKGKPVIINVWATWCGPCVAEMPSLHKLYEDYGRNVTFALISAEKNEVIKEFVQAKGYNFPIFHLGNVLPPELQRNQIPSTFVIGADGNLLIAETGAKDWNSAEVRNLLDKELDKATDTVK